MDRHTWTGPTLMGEIRYRTGEVYGPGTSDWTKETSQWYLAEIDHEHQLPIKDFRLITGTLLLYQCLYCPVEDKLMMGIITSIILIEVK